MSRAHSSDDTTVAPQRQEAAARRALESASADVLAHQLEIERRENSAHHVKDALFLSAVVSVAVIAGYGMIQKEYKKVKRGRK